MWADVAPLIVSAILGGGIFTAVSSIIKARGDAKKATAEGRKIGATTEVEVDSIAVATMSKALASAQERITALQAEREQDRIYYTGRIEELERRVDTLRAEVSKAEEQLAAVLASTEQTATEIQRLKQHPRD